MGRQNDAGSHRLLQSQVRAFDTPASVVTDSAHCRQDELTRQIDTAKTVQQASRQESSSKQEAVREELRKIKAIVVGLFAEKKVIQNDISAVSNNRKETNETIKNQQKICGRFKHEDDIDDEIKRLESDMSHTTMTLKEEKGQLRRIKELNEMRSHVKVLAMLEAKRGTGGSGKNMDEMRATKKEIDEKLDEVKLKEKDLVERLNALKLKYGPKEGAPNKIGDMLDERKALKETVVKNIKAIKVVRDAFYSGQNEWYDKDRYIKGLKNQVTDHPLTALRWWLIDDQTSLFHDHLGSEYRKGKLPTSADYRDSAILTA